MAAVLVDVRTPRPRGGPLGLVEAYAGVAVEVSDLDRARHLYSDLLGFAAERESSDGLTLRIAGDAELTLVSRPSPRTLPDSGAHCAYRLPAGELEAALGRLQEAGVEVHDYCEDRPAERRENRYVADPDGNRVQLVEGAQAGIDHVAVEAHDLEWAEIYYTHALGGAVETRVGWRMEDYARAWVWGEGKDRCAPGTRRWDRPYSDLVGRERRLPRPNPHIFVRLAADVILGIYLATEHRQEPPRRRFAGTPRTVFRAADRDALERRLREVRLRCLEDSQVSGGPFERVEASIFARDPGGNFLEFRE